MFQTPSCQELSKLHAHPFKGLKRNDCNPDRMKKLRALGPRAEEPIDMGLEKETKKSIALGDGVVLGPSQCRMWVLQGMLASVEEPKGC